MQFPAHYTQMLSRFNAAPPSQRAKCAAQWLAGEYRDREAKNRALYDAYHLLIGDWQEERARGWHFVDLGELRVERLRDAADAGVAAALRERIEEAQASTPTRFDDLWERPVPAEPLDYLQWIYEYLPYITLDLPGDLSRATALFLDRLGRLLKPLEGHPAYADNVRAHADRRFYEWRRYRGEAAGGARGAATSKTAT